MLDIKKRSKKYLISVLSVLLFSIIYEHFSFGVSSVYMRFAFFIPLFGFVLSFVFNKNFSNMLLDLSMITLTVGSLLNGALLIYGTTSKFVIVYLIIGLLLLISSFISSIMKK